MMCAITGSSVIRVLLYRDAAEAIDWLVDAFGLEKLLVVPGPNGSVNHSQIVRGTGMIMTGSERDNEPAKDNSLYVVVDEVETHCARASAAGSEIVTSV